MIRKLFPYTIYILCMFMASGVFADSTSQYYIPMEQYILSIKVTEVDANALDANLLEFHGYQLMNDRLWLSVIPHQDENGWIYDYTLHIIPMLPEDVDLNNEVNIADLTQLVGRLFLGW